MVDAPENRSDKSWAVKAGDRISEWTSTLFAHPYMQIGVILFCGAWFWAGLQAGLLTAALSILAITLTQMVLNGQYAREAEARLRDIAMHAKLDELVIAMKGARNEMVGIEELDEERIAELKDQASAEIESAGEAAGDPQERKVAKEAVGRAAKKMSKKKVPRQPGSTKASGRTSR